MVNDLQQRFPVGLKPWLWFIVGVPTTRPPGRPLNLVFDLTNILQRALEVIVVNKPFNADALSHFK